MGFGPFHLPSQVIAYPHGGYAGLWLDPNDGKNSAWVRLFDEQGATLRDMLIPYPKKTAGMLHKPELKRLCMRIGADGSLLLAGSVNYYTNKGEEAASL